MCISPYKLHLPTPCVESVRRPLRLRGKGVESDDTDEGEDSIDEKFFTCDRCNEVRKTRLVSRAGTLIHGHVGSCFECHYAQLCIYCAKWDENADNGTGSWLCPECGEFGSVTDDEDCEADIQGQHGA